MGLTSNKGYVIEALQLVKLLPKDRQRYFLDQVQAENSENVEELLKKDFPKIYPAIEAVFIPSEDVESDDVEPGVMYASFVESTMFDYQPSAQAVALAKAGIQPASAVWADYETAD